jgi:hypothetical protein
MKTAILQLADAGPLVSTVHMLETVGYKCYIPNDELRGVLKSIGCDTVLSPRELTRSWGYDPVSVPETGPKGMESCDLYGDVKAHRCLEFLVKKWPRLKSKILWLRINGGAPEHVIRADGFDCGNERDPPCPVFTPNQWYKTQGPWTGRAYPHWPPFMEYDSYYPKYGRPKKNYFSPICLIHRVEGWGYQNLVEPMRDLGVKFYGVGSPDGLIQHSHVHHALSCAIAMVHLKSSDSPGYAIYECLAAGCPLICTRRLLWRSMLGELLIPGETCLVFDRETHDGLTPQDVVECTTEVRGHLERLRDPVENARIGMNGRQRLREVMWSAEKNGAEFKEWMAKQFGG